MKVNKKKTGYVIVFLILSLWLFFVIRINLKYPVGKTQVYELNEKVEYDGFEICVTKMAFLDKEKTSELLADEIEQFGDCRCALIYVSVKNNQKEEREIELYPFTLESDAWKNSVIMSAYQEINEEYVTEGRVTLRPVIEAGGSYECVLTYCIAKVNFTEKQWKSVENRNYNLVLSLYPVKKSIKVQ